MSVEVCVTICLAIGSLVAALFGWFALQIIAHGRKIAELGLQIDELRLRFDDRGKQCYERLEWIRGMDNKLNEVKSDTAVMRALMEQREEYRKENEKHENN